MPAVDPTFSTPGRVVVLGLTPRCAVRIGRARSSRFGAFEVFGGIGRANSYEAGLTTSLSEAMLDANHLGSFKDISQDSGRLVSRSPDPGLARALASRK